MTSQGNQRQSFEPIDMHGFRSVLELELGRSFEDLRSNAGISPVALLCYNQLADFTTNDKDPHQPFSRQIDCDRESVALTMYARFLDIPYATNSILNIAGWSCETFTSWVGGALTPLYCLMENLRLPLDRNPSTYKLCHWLLEHEATISDLYPKTYESLNFFALSCTSPENMLIIPLQIERNQRGQSLYTNCAKGIGALPGLGVIFDSGPLFLTWLCMNEKMVVPPANMEAFSVSEWAESVYINLNSSNLKTAQDTLSVMLNQGYVTPDHLGKYYAALSEFGLERRAMLLEAGILSN